MIWVAQQHRDHPDEFIATMRGDFGVSLHDLGGSLSWAELLAFTTVAVNDPSTRLGAAVAGWAYPATMPDLISVAANTGKQAEQSLPWGMAKQMKAAASRKVTPADVKAAEARLARVSAFRHLEGFGAQ